MCSCGSSERGNKVLWWRDTEQAWCRQQQGTWGKGWRGKGTVIQAGTRWEFSGMNRSSRWGHSLCVGRAHIWCCPQGVPCQSCSLLPAEVLYWGSDWSSCVTSLWSILVSERGSAAYLSNLSYNLSPLQGWFVLGCEELKRPLLTSSPS